MAMAAGPEVERAEELGALHRVALLVARSAPLETVFHAAGEQSAVLLGAASGAVLRFLGEERAVVLSSFREPGTRGLPVNAEVDFEGPQSALVKVRATRRPARLDSFEFGRGELPRYMRASGVRGALAAPVLVDGEVWGALAVSTILEDPFPPGTEKRLAPFAELVAQAIVNSEARRRLVQAADESRQRLERELHEGAQQHLLALTLKLRLANERAEEGSLFAKLLAEALADANEATSALDDLGRSLHPAVLVERGLAPALQALAARAAIPVHLREVPARRFHGTTEATIYGVVADGLRSADCEVEVSVADRGDRLHVELRGCTGTGLEDAIDRVAALGGHLEVGPASGGEPVVRGTIPVER
jgi:signal transduction histidine kinase